MDMGVLPCFCHNFVTRLNKAFDNACNAGIKSAIFAAEPLVHAEPLVQIEPGRGLVVDPIGRLGNQLRFSPIGEADQKAKWAK